MSTSSRPALDKKADSKKMEELGRMTRGLVHDFNNSLASMMVFAEFLVTDLPEGSETQQFAKNIKAAGDQMQSLLEEIRQLTKPDEQKPSSENKMPRKPAKQIS